MGAHEIAEPSPARSRVETALTWLGGAARGGVGEPHERSAYAIAGVVVLVDAVLAWLVATLAVAAATQTPIAAVLALCSVFALLVATVTRALAIGAIRRRPGLLGRVAVAIAVGVAVGELAALVVFSGAIDTRLDEQATRAAESMPAVASASAGLDRIRDQRSALDAGVEQAREHREEALVVARCEYNPSPACPQTHITGVPGTGPETRTANEVLADAQRELDDAVAVRDRNAPGLDSAIADAERALDQTRAATAAKADRGLGARWVAMNGYTLGNTGALLLRLAAIGFFVLLGLLPLILKLWRGETTDDRRTAARAERDRAELEADTAIAVKQAEVRAEAEILWAEQQLINARMAVEAQTAIDREHHRRRVAQALDAPLQARIEPVEEDVYLPIAAEAEAASRVAGELPAGSPSTAALDNLPAEPERTLARREERSGLPIPTIPDVTNTALRLIRPFVPPIVARAIEGSAQPLRAARQAFEEVEEMTFSFKRTRKVTFDSEERSQQDRRPAPAVTEAGASRWVDSSIGDPSEPDHLRREAHADRSELARASEGRGLVAGAPGRELAGRDRDRELRGPEGPRQLPPAQ